MCLQVPPFPSSLSLLLSLLMYFPLFLPPMLPSLSLSPFVSSPFRFYFSVSLLRSLLLCLSFCHSVSPAVSSPVLTPIVSPSLSLPQLFLLTPPPPAPLSCHLLFSHFLYIFSIPNVSPLYVFSSLCLLSVSSLCVIPSAPLSFLLSLSPLFLPF